MKTRETYCDKCDCIIEDSSSKHYVITGHRWEKGSWITGSKRMPFGVEIDLCPTCYKKFTQFFPRLYPLLEPEE